MSQPTPDQISKLPKWAQAAIKPWELACKKCGHKWIPRNPDKLPVRCPNLKCQSANWNKPTQTQ